jgi:O-antigen/teichoic acid export membrane protein
MAMLYTEHVGESAQVFSILMGCFVATSLSYIFGTLLTANGNLLQLNIMASSGMVFNLSLNAILIPLYHAQGAAVSSLITQFATAILQILLAQRLFKFKINTGLLFQLLVFIPGIVLLAWSSKLLPFGWIINLFIMASTGLLLALLSGLLKPRSLFRILKYE